MMPFSGRQTCFMNSLIIWDTKFYTLATSSHCRSRIIWERASFKSNRKKCRSSQRYDFLRQIVIKKFEKTEFYGCAF